MTKKCIISKTSSIWSVKSASFKTYKLFMCILFSANIGVNLLHLQLHYGHGARKKVDHVGPDQVESETALSRGYYKNCCRLFSELSRGERAKSNGRQCCHHWNNGQF